MSWGTDDVTHTAIVALQCSGCSCLQDAARADMGKRAAGSRQLGHPEYFGILRIGFRMRQHTCKFELFLVKKGGYGSPGPSSCSRTRYVRNIPKGLAHRKGPMYVIIP